MFPATRGAGASKPRLKEADQNYQDVGPFVTALSNTVRGFSSAFTGLPKFVGSLSGIDTLTDFGIGVDQLVNKLTPVDPDYAENWLATYIPQGIGQVGAMLIPGAGLGAAAGKLRVLARAAEVAGDVSKAEQLTRKATQLVRAFKTVSRSLMGGAEGYDAYQRSIERGDSTLVAAAKSLGYATIAGAIEGNVMTRLVSRYARMFGVKNAASSAMEIADPVARRFFTTELVKQYGKEVFVGFGEEASQRLAQDIFIEGRPDIEGILTEGGVGAIVQTLVGTPASVRIARDRVNEAKQRTEDMAPATSKALDAAESSAETTAEDSLKTAFDSLIGPENLHTLSDEEYADWRQRVPDPETQSRLDMARATALARPLVFGSVTDGTGAINVTIPSNATPETITELLEVYAKDDSPEAKIVAEQLSTALAIAQKQAVTPAAVTPAAVTPAAVTPAVVTPAAVTPAAVTPAAVTPAVVTPAAVTPAVVTPAAVTPAAVTPAATPAATPPVATPPVTPATPPVTPATPNEEAETSTSKLVLASDATVTAAHEALDLSHKDGKLDANGIERMRLVGLLRTKVPVAKTELDASGITPPANWVEKDGLMVYRAPASTVPVVSTRPPEPGKGKPNWQTLGSWTDEEIGKWEKFLGKFAKTNAGSPGAVVASKRLAQIADEKATRAPLGKGQLEEQHPKFQRSLDRLPVSKDEEAALDAATKKFDDKRSTDIVRLTKSTSKRAIGEAAARFKGAVLDRWLWHRRQGNPQTLETVYNDVRERLVNPPRAPVKSKASDKSPGKDKVVPKKGIPGTVTTYTEKGAARTRIPVQGVVNAEGDEVITPVFALDAEVAASQVDKSQTVEVPEDITDEQLTAVGIETVRDEGGPRLVTAAMHPKYGRIERAGELDNAYYNDPDVRDRRLAQFGAGEVTPYELTPGYTKKIESLPEVEGEAETLVRFRSQSDSVNPSSEHPEAGLLRIMLAEDHKSGVSEDGSKGGGLSLLNATQLDQLQNAVVSRLQFYLRSDGAEKTLNRGRLNKIYIQARNGLVNRVRATGGPQQSTDAPIVRGASTTVGDTVAAETTQLTEDVAEPVSSIEEARPTSQAVSATENTIGGAQPSPEDVVQPDIFTDEQTEEPAAADHEQDSSYHELVRQELVREVTERKAAGQELGRRDIPVIQKAAQAAALKRYQAGDRPESIAPGNDEDFHAVQGKGATKTALDAVIDSPTDSPLVLDILGRGPSANNFALRKWFSVMRGNRNLPSWVRLLSHMLGDQKVWDKVPVHIVSDPNLSWSGLYVPVNTTSKRTPGIYINLGVKHDAFPGEGDNQYSGLERTILHEVLHHLTLHKLSPGYTLNRAEKEAVDNLKRLYRDTRAYVKAQGILPEKIKNSRELSRFFYGDSSLYGLSEIAEFVVEVVTNPDLQALLSQIPADAKVTTPTTRGLVRTMLNEMRRYLSQLWAGKTVAAGSTLDQAVANVMSLATRAVGPGTESALRLDPAEAKKARVKVSDAAREIKSNHAYWITPEGQIIDAEEEGMNDDGSAYSHGRVIKNWIEFRTGRFNPDAKAVAAAKALKSRAAAIIKANPDLNEETDEDGFENPFAGDLAYNQAAQELGWVRIKPAITPTSQKIIYAETVGTLKAGPQSIMNDLRALGFKVTNLSTGALGNRGFNPAAEPVTRPTNIMAFRQLADQEEGFMVPKKQETPDAAKRREALEEYLVKQAVYLQSEINKSKFKGMDLTDVVLSGAEGAALYNQLTEQWSKDHPRTDLLPPGSKPLSAPVLWQDATPAEVDPISAPRLHAVATLVNSVKEQYFPGIKPQISESTGAPMWVENGKVFYDPARLSRVLDIIQRRSGRAPAEAIRTYLDEEHKHLAGLMALRPGEAGEIAVHLPEAVSRASAEKYLGPHATEEQIADYLSDPDRVGHEYLRQLAQKIETGETTEDLDAIQEPGLIQALLRYLKAWATKVQTMLETRQDPYLDSALKRIQQAERVLKMQGSLLESNPPAARAAGLSDPRRLNTLAGQAAEMPELMRDSLTTARAMAASGASSEAIRAATGWFPGRYDGKMRWEIPDVRAKFLPAFKNIKESNPFKDDITISLGEALDHPALFKAYPDLKNVRVKREQPFADFMGLVQGSYDPSTQTINISPMAVQPRGTLLHEIQHWIQHKEGFAKGGSYSEAFEALPDSRVREFADSLMLNISGVQSGHRLQIQALKSAIDRLNALSPEAVAEVNRLGDQVRRGKPGDDARAVIDQNLMAVLGLLTGQLETSTVMELLHRGAHVQKALTKATEVLAQVEEANAEATAQLDILYRGERDEVGDLLEDSHGSMIYESLAGEIEARTVSSRRTYTNAQLAAIEPYSDSNISREDAVIVLAGSDAQPQLSTLPTPTKSEDATRFPQVVARIKELLAEGKVNSPEWNQLAAEREEIKNRNAGFVPGTEPGATLNAPSPAPDPRGQTTALSKLLRAEAPGLWETVFRKTAYIKGVIAEDQEAATGFVDAVVNNGGTLEDVVWELDNMPKAFAGISAEQAAIARGVVAIRYNQLRTAMHEEGARTGNVKWITLAKFFEDQAVAQGTKLQEDLSQAGSFLSRVGRGLNDLVFPFYAHRQLQDPIYEHQKTEIDKDETGRAIVAAVNDSRTEAAKDAAERAKAVLQILANKDLQGSADDIKNLQELFGFFDEVAGQGGIEPFEGVKEVDATNRQKDQRSVPDRVSEAIAARMVKAFRPKITRIVGGNTSFLVQLERDVQAKVKGLLTTQLREAGDRAQPDVLAKFFKNLDNVTLFEQAMMESANAILLDPNVTLAPGQTSTLQRIADGETGLGELKTAEAVVRRFVDINQVVTQHLSSREATLETLTQTILHEFPLAAQASGGTAPSLTKSQAEAVARSLRDAFNHLVRKTARQKVSRIISSRQSRVTQPPIDQLLKLVNLGAFDEPTLYNLIAVHNPRMKLPIWNATLMAEIRAESDRIQKLPEDSDMKTGAIVRLLSTVAHEHAKNLKGKDKLIYNIGTVGPAIWQAGILSGPPTQMVNLFATKANIAIQSFFDALGYAATAKKMGVPISQTGGFFSDAVIGWFNAVGIGRKGPAPAWTEADRALRTGMTRYRNEKQELLGVLERMDMPYKWVGRFMLAADAYNASTANEIKQRQAFRFAQLMQGADAGKVAAAMQDAFDPSSVALASIEAQVQQELADGVLGTGEDSKRRANMRRVELMENRRFDIMPGLKEEARTSAEAWTFNSSNPKGLAGAIFAGAANQLNRTSKVSKYVLPFMSTLAQLLNTSLDFSPVGIARAYNLTPGFFLPPNSRFRRDEFDTTTPEGMAKFYTQAAKGYMGTAAIMALIAMAVKGLEDEEEGREPFFAVYGSGPSTGMSRRQLQEGMGWQPNTIKIGSLRMRYTDWPALNLALGAIGVLSDSYRFGKAGERDIVENVTLWGLGTINVVFEKNLLSGMSNLFEIISNPDQRGVIKAKQMTSSIAGGFTNPQLLKWMRSTFDMDASGMVERLDNSTTEGWLMSMVPFSVGYNTPALNTLGEPVKEIWYSATTRRAGLIDTAKRHPIFSKLVGANLTLPNPSKNTKVKLPSEERASLGKSNDAWRAFVVYRGEEMKRILTDTTLNRLANMNTQDAQDLLDGSYNSRARNAAIRRLEKDLKEGSVKW